MKKGLLFAVLTVILCVASCGKDKDEPASTYQVINNLKTMHNDTPYLNGTLWEAIVICYSVAGDIVRQDDLNDIYAEGGRSDIIELPGNCTNVRLSFRLVPRESELYNSTKRLYLANKDLIKKGKKLTITVDEMTLVTDELKATGNSWAKSISDFRSVIPEIHYAY
ncbi:MAG TPA: hypothetical protein VK179_04480 [Bacteroidales bacterium]|nr:hypothetical protein [Bacteroidales bacterium]